MVTASEDKKLKLVLMELDFSKDGIFRYENQEFDDLYPVREAPKSIFRRLLSVR